MGRNLKTDYTEETPVNISNVNPSLVNRLNSYCNLLDIERKDFILDLIEDKLEGLVLDNTEIKLDKPFYFNMKELKENGVVKAVNKNPAYEREEIYLVNTVPNNLDTFNRDFKTFCSEDISSFHRGVFIKTVIDFDNAKTLDEALKEVIYIFSYDSEENTLEIVIGNDINMYFTVEQEELKQKYLKEMEERHALFKFSVENEDGTKKEEIDSDKLKELLQLMDLQKSYFIGFKGMKEVKTAFVKMYKDAGMLEDEAVKGFLDKFKEF